MAYRYLGNKSRIADWIASEVSVRLPTNAVIADPMCGTATMSVAFANLGMSVISSDELKFPTLHAKARILGADNCDFSQVAASYEDALNKLNRALPIRGLFWREYSEAGCPINGSKPRRYFTGENGAKIDAMRSIIKEWRRDGLCEHAADLLLHDVVLAVNDVANITGTYGYFRSSWNKASLKPIYLTPTSSELTLECQGQHKVLHGKVEDVAPILKADGCYLDPPYTKRQYAGNYHILETIAQEDEPTPQGQGGLREWSSNASDYCYKRHAVKAFNECLKSLHVPWVFISYSEDGQVPPDQLRELLSSYGKVECLSIPIERFRSNKATSQKNVQEHLYTLEKNV